MSRSNFISAVDAEALYPMAFAATFTRIAYGPTNSAAFVIVAAKRASALQRGRSGFSVLIAAGDMRKVHPMTQRIAVVKLHKAPRTEENKIDPSTGRHRRRSPFQPKKKKGGTGFG
jgi:hypothetical protein